MSTHFGARKQEGGGKGDDSFTSPLAPQHRKDSVTNYGKEKREKIEREARERRPAPDSERSAAVPEGHAPGHGAGCAATAARPD
jgi:hypothetical protein